jgi:adenylylsulfate kinase
VRHQHGSEAEVTPTGSTTATRTGATVWLTGLPSAGKSTVAHGLADRLAADGVPVQVLDGDQVRRHLSGGLGFTREDRDTNVRRIGWVAGLLARHGVTVLVPVIAPYAATREAVRLQHERDGLPYVEVHVATSLDAARSRDVRGLYALAAAGELRGLTGVDDPYEPPVVPDVVLDTEGSGVEETVTHLYSALVERGLL